MDAARRILCLWMPHFSTDRVRRDRPVDASLTSGGATATPDRAAPTPDDIAAALRYAAATPNSAVALDGAAPKVVALNAVAAEGVMANAGAPLTLAKAAAPLVLTRRVSASRMVAQVCPRAARAGLAPGMTLGEAQAMAPGLQALELEESLDRAALEQLAHWALRFSPAVQPLEPDALLSDVTGCQRLFGGEPNLARQAVAGLRARGFMARAAVADTVGAACALAFAHADPLVVCPPGQGSAFLAPLPPAALRLEPQAVERLEALGVRKIADLLSLPRVSLPSRFGPRLTLRIQQALGETFEPLAPQRDDQPPSARYAFDGAVRALAPLQRVAGELLEIVYAQVRARDAALRQIDCVLPREHAPPTALCVRLSRASRAWKRVTELVQRRLETIDLGAGVLGVAVLARETTRWHGVQGELFEPFEPGACEQLAGLLDRLINRLGRRAVGAVELLDDYQPEAAFRYRPQDEPAPKINGRNATAPKSNVRNAAAPKSNVRSAMAPKANTHDAGAPDFDARFARHRQPDFALPVMPRPLRLLSRPLPIRVISLVPDGPPTWLALAGQEHAVAAAWGPERIETGWWRGPDTRRDYFRVCSETGEQFWVYRDRVDGGWRLHGLFT